MTGKLNLLRHLGVSFGILLAISCFFSTVLGQSGRRTPKTKTVAAPIPEPEPTPTPAKQSSQPRITFILGMEQPDVWGVSLQSVSGVRRSCAQRLDEPESIRVEVTQLAMSRSDAVNRAKSEKDSYVVWLRLRDDSMGGRQDLAVEYTVFAPGTAKNFTSGSTYPNRNSKVILGRRTSDINGDYYLNIAAQEAADRILAKFSISTQRRLPLAAMK